jgi:phosphatidate cytidylyltransferase
MNNFQTRTITGLSLVIILLAALIFSGWVFAIIFLLITILGLSEFYTLISTNGIKPQKWFGTAAGATIYLGHLLVIQFPGLLARHMNSTTIPFVLLLLFSALVFIIEIYRNQEYPLINIAFTLTGLLYVAIPFTLLLVFTGPEEIKFAGLPVILVSYFCYTWIYDTVAYLFGKQFGKHKLFERISPKKTWEGTLGGAVVTIGFSIFLSSQINEMPWFDYVIPAFLVIIFGSLGDLTESMLKRSLRIKDSGTILPGHGGILDRFDTMLISVPFVFLYFLFRNLI